MSVRVMTDVWENSTHGGTELLVLLKLADHADDEHREAWPSVAYVAKRCRVSTRTVARSLRVLQGTGEIEMIRAPTPRSPAHWCVLPSRGDELSPLDTGVHPGWTPVSTEPSIEPSERNTASSGRTRPSPLTEEIHCVFDHWRERCRHPQAKLTADRRLKVMARLREGYSVEQIKLGIDNAASHAYVNTEGRRFDDLELICRSGSKLEDFMRRGSGIDRTSVADFLKR